MNAKTTTRTTLAVLALAAVLSTGACAAGAATAAPTVAGTNAPVATVAPVPAATTPAPAATPTPTADQYSQVIGGVLYQGTADAPVRIGTDTPGQAPAAQAQLQRGTSEKLALAANKYLVYVLPIPGKGWAWKIFGADQWGNLEELAGSGYREGVYLPNRASAITGPFVIDGRSLDPAEFILAAEN